MPQPARRADCNVRPWVDVDALSAGEIWIVGESRDSGPTPYQARAMHCC